MESISTVMALHIRYPGHGGHKGPADSQLDRTLNLINTVFDKCQTRACIHQNSIPLVDYLYYDDFHSHHRPHGGLAHHLVSVKSL